MLAWPGAPGNRNLEDVEPFLREAASNRDGDWEVHLGEDGAWCNWCARRRQRYQRVRFSEAEFARLTHLVRHPMVNGTKSTTFKSNLEQAAHTLWPTGSTEHMAMRVFGITAVVAWVTSTGAEEKNNFWTIMTTVMIWILEFISPFDGLFKKRKHWARLERRSEPKERRAPDSTPLLAGNNRDAQPGGANDVDGGKEDPSDPADVGIHGGRTPDDADIIASVKDRMIHKNDAIFVVGAEYDENANLDSKSVVGAVIGPIIDKPNVYANTFENVQAGKRERLDKKAKPFTGTRDDIQRLGKFVSAAIIGNSKKAIFSSARVRRWAEEFIHLDTLKSGK